MSNRDDRNARAWAGYDNWLLRGSGVYDDTPEIFESDHFPLFTCFEQVIIDFDTLIEEAKKDPSIYKKIEDYDLEELEDYKYYLTDNEICGVLHRYEEDALEEKYDHIRDEKEAYEEAKGEAMREKRQLRGDK